MESKTNDLICLRHPSYKGRIVPFLGCKTCCRIFLNEVTSGRFKELPVFPFPSKAEAPKAKKLFKVFPQ